MRLFAALLTFAVVQGCGYRADLDPRDEAAIEAQDCRSSTVTLKAKNQSSFSMRIILVSRGGSRWRLQPQIHGFNTREYRVSRHFLDNGGYILLEITGGGLLMTPTRPISMTSLMCNTGTLFITPSPSMSSYVGVDF